MVENHRPSCDKRHVLRGHSGDPGYQRAAPPRQGAPCGPLRGSAGRLLTLAQSRPAGGRRCCRNDLPRCAVQDAPISLGLCGPIELVLLLYEQDDLCRCYKEEDNMDILQRPWTWDYWWAVKQALILMDDCCTYLTTSIFFDIMLAHIRILCRI